MEVLVSILIMSIGIVCVISLIPVAALRSLHATQYTNATIVRFNVESLIDVLATPPGGFNSGLLGCATGIDTNTSNFFVPAGGTAIIDPLGFFHPDLDSQTPPTSWPVIPGTTGLNPSPYTTYMRYGTYWDSTKANVIATLSPSAPIRFDGGVGTISVPSTTPLPWPNNGNSGSSDTQATAFQRAQTYCAISDSWSVLYEENGTAFVGPNTQLQLDEVNFTNFGSAGLTMPAAPFATRVVLFNPEGTASYTVPVLQVTGGASANSVVTTAGQNTIPAQWRSGLGRVVVETQVERYSWLITARRDALGLFDCDVVVFYKRGYAKEDEYTFIAPSTLVDANGTSVLSFRQNSDLVAVEYDSSTGAKPFFRRGGWVFDVENARWYRILDVSDDPTINPRPFDRLQSELGLGARPTGSGGSMKLLVAVLHRKSAFSGRQAMFPRGVVDVYPIGVKTP